MKVDEDNNNIDEDADDDNDDDDINDICFPLSRSSLGSNSRGTNLIWKLIKAKIDTQMSSLTTTPGSFSFALDWLSNFHDILL